MQLGYRHPSLSGVITVPSCLALIATIPLPDAPLSLPSLLDSQEKKKKGAGPSNAAKAAAAAAAAAQAAAAAVEASASMKQPVLDDRDLLDAVLADCLSDPEVLSTLKTSFKRLLQV
jgi:hypothetical protein